ncbi:MAG: calcium-binding protein, partial [Boseongicola sp.]
MNTTAYFDPATADTPQGLNPSVAFAGISGVPAQGTGLAGAAFVPGTNIWNIELARAAAAVAEDADATFVTTEFGYGAKNSDTSIAEFLGEDGASVSGDGNLEMGPSALTFTGYIYIPPGVHEISVTSDDGFDLNIGGVDFSEFASGRSTDSTGRVADFEGGLYEFDLLYFDSGSRMSLSVEVDGLPVDQSAFYQSITDFTDPDPTVPTIPVDEYHPSFFLGVDSLATPIDGTGTEGRDVINGKGADDLIEGNAGDDELSGGYGDDTLRGGDGDDVLDGGRGSDVLEGGAGNDLLIARSDAAEQKIGQLAIDKPTREDPDGEVDPVTQKLAIYNDQPIVGDDVLIGGEGEDTFLISPQINAKLDIIEEHVKADGSINWAGVAGENNELHDHWVDSSGIDIIADYNADEDHIAVIGHTANVYVEHKDVMGDEALESIITVISNQHGGGGAHDMDLIGQVIVHGDLVEKGDIQTDANVTYGIVEGYDDVAEALFPQGEEKITIVDGVEYKGYDTRTPSAGSTKETNNGMGTENVGPVTGDPFGAFSGNLEDGMLASGSDGEEGYEETRFPFEQLETVDVVGQNIEGGAGNDRLTPD